MVNNITLNLMFFNKSITHQPSIEEKQNLSYLCLFSGNYSKYYAVILRFSQLVKHSLEVSISDSEQRLCQSQSLSLSQNLSTSLWRTFRSVVVCRIFSSGAVEGATQTITEDRCRVSTGPPSSVERDTFKVKLPFPPKAHIKNMSFIWVGGCGWAEIHFICGLNKANQISLRNSSGSKISLH